MGIMPYLHFSVFLIYSYLTVFIILKNPKALLNWICSVIFISLAVWSFSFIFIHNHITTMRTARLFFNISSFGWCGFPLFVLWFVFVFTGKNYLLKKWVTYPLTILPAAFFVFIQWHGMLVKNFVPVYFGWGAIWPSNVWFYMYALYVLLVSFITLYMLERYRKTTDKNIEKKKAFIIILCTGIPLAISFITNVFLPSMHVIIIPDTGPLVSIVWAVGMVYFILKYKYFTLTPTMAAEDIIDTMTDSLILVSTDKKIIRANMCTCELLGYKEAELKDKPVDAIFGEYEKHMPFEDKEYALFLERGYIQNLNTNYRSRSGRMISVNLSGSVISDKGGNMAGIVLIARDMRHTLELMKKEKKLAVADASAKAERIKAMELEKAYNKLKDAQRQLIQSEKLRELGEMGANVVNELNVPLEGVMELMRAYKAGKAPNTKEYEDINEMEKGCEFMSRIIRSLGDFTRGSSSNMTPLNCNIMIDSILGFMKTKFESGNIRIFRKYDGKIPEISGNRYQIQQVFYNIINNAIDALSGGGDLYVSTGTVTREGQIYVEIRFEDTGKGIESDIIDKIFDPFFTTKEPGMGVGLGLSVTHSIVRAHKGELSVKSVTGRGSVFKVLLPVTENSGKGSRI